MCSCILEWLLYGSSSWYENVLHAKSWSPIVFWGHYSFCQSSLHSYIVYLNYCWSLSTYRNWRHLVVGICSINNSSFGGATACQDDQPTFQGAILVVTIPALIWSSSTLLRWPNNHVPLFPLLRCCCCTNFVRAERIQNGCKLVPQPRLLVLVISALDWSGSGQDSCALECWTDCSESLDKQVDWSLWSSFGSLDNVGILFVRCWIVAWDLKSRCSEIDKRFLFCRL
jgi:hypothetical protein